MRVYGAVVGETLVAASANPDFDALRTAAEIAGRGLQWSVYRFDAPVDVAKSMKPFRIDVQASKAEESASGRAVFDTLRPYITERLEDSNVRTAKKWKQERRRRRRVPFQIWYRDADGSLMTTAKACSAPEPEEVKLPSDLKIQTVAAEDLIARALSVLRAELTAAAQSEGYGAVRVGDRLLLVSDKE